MVHDPSDTYLDPVGGTRHEEDIRAMYGSLERSDLDREKMLNIKDLEDTTEDQPDILRPHDFAGGVGTKAHLHQVGNQIGAWYSSWWEHPNVEDLEEETQEMFGLASDVSGEPAGTDEGKRKLILKGLNVNGWEPGRTTEEVREDHLTHTQVSPGFWNDDLTQAEPADTTVHHPCGSPLRKRPCEDEEEHTLPPGGGSDSPVTANANRAGGHQRVAVNVSAICGAARARVRIWVARWRVSVCPGPCCEFVSSSMCALRIACAARDGAFLLPLPSESRCTVCTPNSVRSGDARGEGSHLGGPRAAGSLVQRPRQCNLVPGG